jgi:hypothetical protein
VAPLATLSRRRRAAGPGAAGGGRLRSHLLAAGPIAAAFAIHLGSRVDLLAGTDCIELLAIPDRAPASDPQAVAGFMEQALNAPLSREFDGFDAAPFDSGLLFQWHHAQLLSGEAVTVELAHPELENDLDSGRLCDVVEQLIAAGELPSAARGAVAEFEQRLDLERGAAALERLAEETADSRWVEVPTVHTRLCSSRVRVLSTIRGRMSTTPAGESAVRRLGRIWLSLALAGDLFPADPWGRNVAYLEGGRVAFLNGEVHRLPRALRSELREYLTAVAGRDPARAALAFLELLPGSPSDRRLRDRIRHTDPFRDRGWDVGGDLFARQVLAHWRSAAELGYQLPEGLGPFYRGLFLLNHEARGQVAEGAPVRDGFREARLLLLFSELRREGEDGRWAGTMEHQLNLLTGLPRKLDRVLTLAAERDRSKGHEDHALSGVATAGNSWATVAACLLALIAVVLFTHHLMESGGAGAWAERIGAGLVLLLGGLLLRAATRPAGD